MCSLDDEVDNLMLEHRLCVGIRDQERDIVALYCFDQRPERQCDDAGITHRHRFPPQHHETLRTLGHKSGEFVGQDALNLVRLLDLNADSHRVHRRFDQDAFILIARDGQGIEEDLLRRSIFGLGQARIMLLGTHWTSTSGLLCRSTT